MSDERLAIGIDLGGTKIEGVLVRPSADGVEVLDRVRTETLQLEGYDSIVRRVAGVIEQLCAGSSRPAPIGVGMPGGVERSTGFVKNSNTVCLNGRPFRADLERSVGTSIAFENDANCFALAETLSGAGREHAGGVVFGVIMGRASAAGWSSRARSGRASRGSPASGGTTASTRRRPTRAPATAVVGAASRPISAGLRSSATTPRAPARMRRSRRSRALATRTRTPAPPSRRCSRPSVVGSRT